MAKKHRLEKPIFIIGTGRCGSTIFQEVICAHPNLAYLSSIYDYYASNPGINRYIMGAIDLPIIGPRLRSKKILKPWEPYKIWNHNYPGFAEPFRDLHDYDVTIRTSKKLNATAEKLITEKRNRLLVKITGWPRIGMLQEVFPDAKFIHVVRDGRAFVNSVLNVDWWSGWQGPANWRWGDLNDQQQKIWEESGKSYVALASIEYNILVNSIQAAQKQLNPTNFFEIRYEDFCRQPVSSMKNVTEFCELPWTSDFEASVKQFKIRSMNYKWKEELTPAQQQIMNHTLAESLEYYGYEVQLDSSLEPA